MYPLVLAVLNVHKSKKMDMAEPRTTMQEEGAGLFELNDLEERFSQVNLVDSRALDFAVRRIETLKIENERLKPSLTEQGVLHVARHLAKLAAGLVVQDFGLSAALRRLSGGEKSTKELERLLQQHQPQQVLGWRDETKHGASVLHLVASVGNLSACQLLIEQHGLSVWDVDVLGRTPLHLAAMQQHLHVCEYITRRAEESGKSMKGPSAPLDMAGCTPAALSALASRPPYGVNAEAFETNRKSVKRHLHVIGDACISPRKPQSAVAPHRRATGLSAKQQFSSKSSSRFGKRMLENASPNSESDQVTLASVNFGFHLMHGWTVKMEDVVFAKQNVFGSPVSIFAVFDGHGGVLCADRCKQLLESSSTDSILYNLFVATKDKKLTEAAESICEELESRLSTMPEFELKQVKVREAIGGEPAKYAYKCQDESGTTLLMALVTPDKIVVAHVGDSRACLVYKPSATEEHRKDRAITRDHKLTVDDTDDAFVQGEKERIERAGGFIVNGKRVAVERSEESEGGAKASLGMTRSIGDFWAKTNRELPAEMQAVSPEPEIWSMERHPGEVPYFLVMASDGVWDVMTEPALGEFVRDRWAVKTQGDLNNEQVLKEIAAEICDKCLELESQDNMSVIIVDLDSQSKRGEDEPQQPTTATIRRPMFTDSSPRSPSDDDE